VLSKLEELGWSEERTEQFEPHTAQGRVPGRIAVQHRGAYVVATENGDLRAEAAGRLVHEAASPADLPAVGDWVAVAPRPDEGAATIHAVLPRRTAFSRKAAWQAAEEQVLAANVDDVLLVMSLNEDFNLRRLERYLTLGWESGAQPAVVLTKADLHEAPEAAVLEVEAVAYGVPVHVVSVVTGEGLDALAATMRAGRTLVVLGSSGVGKSTLVNTLAGEELLATGEIRADGRGRHTTSHRELVVLPAGGIVIDTPGLREFQLWESSDGLEEAFDDVASLALECRFNDCSHGVEPGCAIRAALDAGTLPRDRWDSYVKLERELAHLERKLDKRRQADERRRWRIVTADAKAAMRLKGRRV